VSRQLDRENLAIQYLLGNLSDEEMARLEERFFSDNQEFEELEIAEDELIDRYVRQELSPEDRKKFEQRIQSYPRLAARVDVGRVLAARFSSSPPLETVEQAQVIRPKPAWWKTLFGLSAQDAPALRFGFASAAAFIGVAILALVLGIRLHNESQRLAAEQQQRAELERQIKELKNRSDELDASLKETLRKNEELLAKLPQPTPPPDKPSSSIFSLFLLPGSQRGGGGQTKKIPPETSNVEVSLELGDGGYRQYTAVLQTFERKVLTRESGLRPVTFRSSKVIRFRVSAQQLPPGDYLIHVDGVNESGATESFNDYTFRIARP
jgi:hypothetical protein